MVVGVNRKYPEELLRFRPASIYRPGTHRYQPTGFLAECEKSAKYIQEESRPIPLAVCPAIRHFVAPRFIEFLESLDPFGFDSCSRFVREFEGVVHRVVRSRVSRCGLKMRARSSRLCRPFQIRSGIVFTREK